MAKNKKHGKVTKSTAKKPSKNDNRRRKIKYVDPISGVSKDVRATVQAIAEEIERAEVPSEVGPAAGTTKAATTTAGPQPTATSKAEKRRLELARQEGIEVKDGMTRVQAHRIADKLRNPPLRNIPPANYKGHGGKGAHIHSGNAEQTEYDEEAEEEAEDDDVKTEEDYSDTANERAREYRKGGYHPVLVGEIYNNRYRVVRKLGWGYFSTVWLVWDYAEARYQAMKVQKSAKHYTEAAYDEIRLLSDIMHSDAHKTRHCARLNDYFEHAGPNGVHVCMVFDVYGENLLCLIERYECHGIPLPIVKYIARQVLIALNYLASIDIIHTDLKPENVLLATPKHAIISLMRHYHPPPLHQRPKLLERDPKTMTKSQRRRYYKRLAKEKELIKTASEARPTQGGASTSEGGKAASNARAGSRSSADTDDEAATATAAISNAAAGTAETAAASPPPPSRQRRSSGEGTKARHGDENAEDEEDDDSEEGMGTRPSFYRGSEKGSSVRAKEGEQTEATAEEENDADSQSSKTDTEWEVNRFRHVVVADFGNSCWTYKHFTDEVQTRQYRSPEVILGEPYSTPIDIWSCACMIFELITGEFLFDPKKGDDYSRDEDHLALMSELLGDLPESMRLGNGKYRGYFYNSKGELRNIKNLHYWDLEDVLYRKHRFTHAKAKEIADFLLPMLEYIPEERATPAEMLRDFDSFFEVKDDDYRPLRSSDRASCSSSGRGSEDEENDYDEEDEDVLTSEAARHTESEVGSDEAAGMESCTGSSAVSRGSSLTGASRERTNKSSSIANGDERSSNTIVSPYVRGGSSGHEGNNGNGRGGGAATTTAAPVLQRTPANRLKPRNEPASVAQPRRVDTATEREAMRQYWEEHPILNCTALEARGLTIMDIQAVLSGKTLDDTAAQAAANEVIRLLSEEKGRSATSSSSSSSTSYNARASRGNLVRGSQSDEESAVDDRGHEADREDEGDSDDAEDYYASSNSHRSPIHRDNSAAELRHKAAEVIIK